MKITATKVNYNGELEYTVVPTVEERNWMAVYANMRRNLREPEMRSLDRLASAAWDYGSTKCRELFRVLDMWRVSFGCMQDVDMEPAYVTVMNYDESECLRAYRHMTRRFNNEQVEELNDVLARISKYDPETRGLMLDAMVQAADLIDGGAELLLVRGAFMTTKAE